MAASLEQALGDADVILLLVRHTQLTSLSPDEVASKARGRIVIDCVNGWDARLWRAAGFTVHRLGVNKEDLVDEKS
jgi:predicted dinucleotide-binding enzyme